MTTRTNLSDDTIVLLAPEPEDTDFMFHMENDTTLWEVGNNIAPCSRLQIWTYIKNYEADIFTSRQLRFIIAEKEGGRRVGMIDLFDFDPINRHASVGIVVGGDCRGKNYGMKALTLLCGYSCDRLGIHQLACVVAADNTASLTMFRNCGFEQAGVYKQWIRSGSGYKDALLLQRILD